MKGLGIVKGRLLSVFFTFITILTTLTEGIGLKPKYQPELDQLSMEKYVTNERLFNLHIRCLLFDGPCDSVGRWMKPRMPSYFLGSCIMCTPNQEKESEKFITWLYENHPQLFRTGIAKYLDANGITLPKDSKFREQVQNMNIPKIASGEEVESSAEDEDSQQEPQPQLEQANAQQNQNQQQQTAFHNDESDDNQKDFIPNSRQNKFSSAMMSPDKRKHYYNGQIGHSNSRMADEVEDDEAEAEFDTTTLI